MADAGYIYALINPSLEGLVKVGRTRRDPTDRVKELSASTAAPTPFVLAYDVYVDDCQAAEAYLHSLLARRGYRVSENREFFNAPLKDVVKAMLEVEASRAPYGSARHRGDAAPQGTRDEWDDILEEAQAYYLGEGETIEDKKEALKLFKQAARLGAPDAFYALGIMHRDGEGCEANAEEALEYFKIGVAKGSDDCHAEMALLFTQEGHLENATKCWSKYLRSEGFTQGASGHEAAYGHAYLTRPPSPDIPREHLEALQPYARDILSIADDAVREAEGEARETLKRRRREIKKRLRISPWSAWVPG
jgi:hypothetical protein